MSAPGSPLRLHCFEVDREGKIIKPTLRPDPPDWLVGPVIWPGEAEALMFRQRGDLQPPGERVFDSQN